jgi:hypothetical protein
MTLLLPNPWTAALWSITAQGQFVRKHGTALAAAYARAAGVEIGATKPAPDVPAPTTKHLTRIVNKIFPGGSRGYDGFGPPGEDI